MEPSYLGDVARAGAVAAVLSGVPSTLWAFASGTDPWAPSLAAGSMLLPGSSRRSRLLVAAAGIHAVLSVGWAQVLAGALGGRHRSAAGSALLGAAGGLAIAALDLGLAHAVDSPRLSGIRMLPVLPQVADHLAYGAVVGALLASGPNPARPLRRAARCGLPCSGFKTAG